MKHDVTHLMKSADTAMRRGQVQLARRHWEEVLLHDPVQPIALNALGTLALQDRHLSAAADYFLRAAEAEPTATVLWLNHAKVARELGDDAAERVSLLHAAAIDPQALIVHVRLAEQAERLGEISEASKRWRMVVTIAEAMESVPADALPVIDHARSFLARETEALSARVEHVLAARRSATDPRDRRRVDAAVDHLLGRRTIYLNQCSGLHVPFLPAEEFFDRALFPWFEHLESATAAIWAEISIALKNGRKGFEPYVSLPPGTPTNIWTALDKSTDWSTLHLWRHGKRDHAACEHFPQTAAVIDGLNLAQLPGRMPTIFFSILAPHAHIPPHTGVTNARAIVHLPLIVPSGCRFRVGGETRTWVEGEAFAFDDTIEHEAWNDSDDPRVVLILDTWNPYLEQHERDLLVDFYSATEAEVMSF